MSSSGGSAKHNGRTNSREAMPPKGMHRAIARETSTSGWAHSSVIDVTMPMAEKAYAGGRRPMKKVKPVPQPEKLLS